MRYIKLKDVIVKSIIRIILASILIISFSGLALAQTNFVQKDFQPTFQNAIPLNISNTGAATYNIPIIVPPGRGGIAMPNLALVYNSQQKNGWVGMGWDLEVGSIQRSTKWGVDYNGAAFVVDGSIELVPKTAEWGSGYYGAKIEAGFTKYKFNGAATGWEVTARDGTRYFYGTTDDSRQYDPNNVNRVFKWCLKEIRDTNNNTMTIAYYKDTNNGEIYPAEINYPGNNNKVEFIRESTPRQDKPPRYDTLWKVVTAYRLKTIKVSANNGNLAIRRYELGYDYGASSGRSQLNEVKVYGSDGSTLPPMEFEWQQGGGGNFGNSQQAPVQSWDCFFRFADIDGDGRDDFVMISNRDVYAYLSQGNTFGSGIPTTLSDGSMVKFYLFDVNGDGKADLVRLAGSTIYTNLSTGLGKFEADSNQSSLSYGTQGSVYIGDVSGDGLADIITKNKANYTIIWTHLSNGHGTFTHDNGRTLEGFAVEGYLSLGDVNGDGFTDIVMYPSNNQTNIYTFLASTNGDGTFGAGINYNVGALINNLQIVDVNGDGLGDLTRRLSSTLYTCLSKGDGTYGDCNYGSYAVDVSFADVNGDGYVDLIGYGGTNSVNVYLAQGDGTFRNPVSSNWGQGGPPFFLADINGDGLSDIIHFYSPTGVTVYPSLAVGPYPDLLTVAKNGLGAKIDISYEPSSSYLPGTNPRPNLPFIVNTVSSTSVKDGNGVVSDTTYTYADGYYDHATRDFWGFNKTIQTNPDHTTVTTWYHNDPAQPLDEYRKGRPSEVDFNKPVSEESAFLTKQTLNWETYTYSANPDPTTWTWAFVKLAQQRTDFYNNPIVHAQENYTYFDNYNSHGYWLTKATSGIGAEQVTTTNTYQSYGTWLWRQKSETVTGGTSVMVRQRTYDYYSGTGNLHYETRLLSPKTNQEPATDPQIEISRYDSFGNPEEVLDARDKKTITVYDTTNTYPSIITYPQTPLQEEKDHIVKYPEYDYRFGKPKKKIDERGNPTTYAYDPFGRLKEVHYPDEGQQIITYSDIRDATKPLRFTLTQVKEESGKTIDTYEYFDGLNRKVQTITLGENKQPIVTRIYYDEMGRIVNTSGPFFGAITYPQDPPENSPYVQTTYDYRGRPTHVLSPSTRPDGYTCDAETIYSYSGFATTITDPDGKQKGETRDYLGRIVKVTEYANTGAQNTTYTYNAAGDLLQINDPLNNTITNTYDTLGRKIAMIDPDLGSWDYIYDPNGNLLSETNDREGVMVANESTEVDNTYDAMNRVISETKIIQDEEYTTGYKYDVAGKPTLTTYPDDYKVEYKYWDGSGLLHTVTGITDSEVYASCSGYQPTGKMGQIVHGNDTTTTYIYEPRSTRLTDIVTVGPSGGIQNREYKYTVAGDISTIRDNLKPSTYTYEYDNLHRLLLEKIGGNFSISYSYDKIGNITQKKVGADTYVYTYDDPVKKHAVKAITLNGGTPNQYTYDEVGNMTEGPDFTNPAIATRKIGYYADNLPATIEHSSSGSTYFYYDGLGNRVMKYAPGGGITYYIGDHFEVKDGVETKYIFAGNLRMAKVTPLARYYYHKDHLSSSSAVTDDNGAVIEMTEYRPFGDERDHAGEVVSDYKFTDQELDTETGLYNYDARHYDAVIGRFISADTTISRLYEPQSLNRYSYVRNNPLMYIDPDGQAEYFSPSGDYLGTINPEDKYVYVRYGNNRNVPLHISIKEFHEVVATVFAEASEQGIVDEARGIARTMKTRADKRKISIHDVGTDAGQYTAANKEKAKEYSEKWQHGGAKLAPSARTGVIDAILDQNNPIGNRTMFEGNKLLSGQVGGSHFKEWYIDTNVAYDPQTIGGTTFYMERTKKRADEITAANAIRPADQIPNYFERKNRDPFDPGDYSKR